MGFTTAYDLAESMDIDTALTWHLRSNHYPPVPLSMLQPCKDAIDAYWEDDCDRLIYLNGTTWRGQDEAPAWAIIEGHHLGAWCTDYDYDADYDEDYLV